MANTCDICGRSFKTAAALGGHKRFKHPALGQGGDPASDDVQLATRRDVQALAGVIDETLTRHQQILMSIDDGVDQLLKATSAHDDPHPQSQNGDHAGGHSPGPCDERYCRPCREFEKAIGVRLAQETTPGIIKQTEENIYAMLQQAAEWKGEQAEAAVDTLVGAVEDWKAAGQPKPGTKKPPRILHIGP